MSRFKEEVVSLIAARGLVGIADNGGWSSVVGLNRVRFTSVAEGDATSTVGMWSVCIVAMSGVALHELLSAAAFSDGVSGLVCFILGIVFCFVFVCFCL